MLEVNTKVLKDRSSDATEKTSMADQVYYHLLEGILNGKRIPGEIIDRVSLAAELNVSLAPVAQALDRLTMEGLVETLPRKYSRVCLVRPEDIKGQFVLRLALERQAVVMTHGSQIRKVKKQILELAEMVDQRKSRDPSAWPAEIQFHQALVDLAECSALSETYRQVMRRNYFFALNSAHVKLGDEPRPERKHSFLVTRLCSDDLAVAEQGLWEHLRHDIEAFVPEILSQK
jgi:DNA-binding GntR family transcriptional regulator